MARGRGGVVQYKPKERGDPHANDLRRQTAAGGRHAGPAGLAVRASARGGLPNHRHGAKLRAGPRGFCRRPPRADDFGHQPARRRRVCAVPPAARPGRRAGAVPLGPGRRRRPVVRAGPGRRRLPDQAVFDAGTAAARAAHFAARLPGRAAARRGRPPGAGPPHGGTGRRAGAPAGRAHAALDGHRARAAAKTGRKPRPHRHLRVHIRHLREKIEDNASKPRFLLTVRGIGYKLAGEDTP